MSAPLVFLDTETTGLDPDRHEVWEIAAIVRGHRDIANDGEWLWQIKPDLAAADPAALRIGRYYERECFWMHDTPAVVLASPSNQRDHVRSKGAGPFAVARTLAHLLDGAHIVGAVPAFDTAFLARLLRRHGQAPTWHYHLIDVEALAVGYLAGRGQAPGLPWRSDDLSRACGVEPPGPDQRHTALGDARWVERLYDAITGGPS